jgi:DNA-binding XRE family transcriptional regulator
MMNSSTNLQTIEFHGERFVILPETIYKQLTGGLQPRMSSLSPAVAAMRAVIGRDIVKDRETVGWSQAELARRAGIRVETLNRIETGKRSPSVLTMQKIDDAFKSASKSRRRS